MGVSLELSNVWFSYGPHAVLEEIHLSVQSGEVIVLLGANGSGKTTLLKTIARQLPIDQGSISVGGISISKIDRRKLAQLVCLMPQFEHRDTMLTVQEVVSLGRAPHSGWWAPWNSQDQCVVQESMEATGVWELRDRIVSSLSGGEWRRMVLARSLAQEASILLLDEPTEGLDLKYQYECLEKVREIVRARNLIAVLSLHDLQQAAYFADRIAIIAGKRLVACGSPGEVLTPPILDQAFGIEVAVVPNPVHGKPLVVPVP